MYMTLVGVIGFLAYTAYSAMVPAADAVETTGGFDESIIFASPLASSAAQRASAPSNPTEPETIGEGSTRDDVVALWGNPTATDQSNDRWTYGRTVVLFSNDRVIGILTLTTKQLSSLKNVRPADKAVARTPVATAAKRAATKKAATGRRGAPAAYPVTQNLPGGYAPMGQSAGRSGQFFWAPMYRSFYTNQAMPRSQSHLSPGRSGTPTYSQSYYQRPFRR